MSERSIELTTIKGGINRQRVKGAALADSLYDLLNGYVTKSRTVKVRPGTFRHAHLSVDTLVGTRGLAAFDGKLHVFSASVITVPAGFTLHVLQHPTDQTIDLDTIHFAAPFLGFLYVVAEFANGDVFHFWLQTKGSWSASTKYQVGDVVSPSTPNGLLYRAVRLTGANPAWAPNVPRAVNDVIEPTVPNGFKYTVTDVDGAAPASGPTEPTWPATDGATVVEEVDTEPTDAASTAASDPTPTPISDVTDRYG